MRLTNRIAMITGGTKGIGASTALLLAREGADIALVARQNGDHATDIKRQIQALDRRCELFLADVGIPDDVSRCVREATDRLGTLSIVVHAAGGPVNGDILKIDPEDWMRAFDTHVHSVYYLCRAVLPAMRTQREGAIVLISSVAGLRGLPKNICYQVVKGALPQFSRALAYAYAADNIRVNCIAPGIIRTAFHDTMTAEQQRHNLEHRIPLAREGIPDQIARAAKELIENDYITGEMITVDGGLSMRIA